MRYIAIALLFTALGCSPPREAADARPASRPSAQSNQAPLVANQPAPIVHFNETPTLEQAVALSALPTDAPQTEIARRLSEGPDYIATLNTERPVSHHSYLYERRRSGHWMANVYRRGDGTREEINYVNLHTGASISIARNDDGEITNLWVTQRAERGPALEPTEETGSLLGERCTIWRSRPTDSPGVQSLGESCITNDGVELWQQSRVIGIPTRPPYTTGRVEVASIARGRIDRSQTRPPREILEWSYWQQRSVAAAIATSDAPPDHTVWYEEGREAARGYVTRAQYRDNVRTRLTHRWHSHGNEREFSYSAPGLAMHGRIHAGPNTWREFTISTPNQLPGWRPDPSAIARDPTPTTIIGRQCYWHSMREPPHDAWSRECWTDDGYILATDRHGRGGRSGEAAVRLSTTRPPAPLAPPREFFDWMRAVAE